MNRIRTVLMLAAFTLMVNGAIQAQLYMTNSGQVTFESDAPLEFITASSGQLSGAINLDDNRFAFRMANKSFVGFNSPLQQEHFYENYIETDKYTYSTFQGKIIEEIDGGEQAMQRVRAKGILSIHGVEQERIINATVQLEGDTIRVAAVFQVPLEDHDIRIPKVVYNKIAELIDVDIRASLVKKKD